LIEVNLSDPWSMSWDHDNLIENKLWMSIFNQLKIKKIFN
jgi:hypothetical protein